MPPLHRFFLIAGTLALLAGGSVVLENMVANRTQAESEARVQDAAERVLTTVEERLLSLERELIGRAEQLAGRPVVREALQNPGRRGEAIRLFEKLSLPHGYAVELYTPLPEAIAWTGPALPADPATRRLTFLTRIQSSVVSDGAMRHALVVWYPVRNEGRLLGAVRVVRLLRVEVPVQNQYLQDFDLFARWTRGLVPAVNVHFETNGVGEQSVEREVRGIDGFTLVHLSAQPPDVTQLVASVRRNVRNVRAFFLTLLMGWGVFGMTAFAAHRFHASLREPTRRRVAEASASMAACLATWVSFRYGLLALGVPARYVEGMPPPKAFDPAFLGSGFGAGIAGTAAELVLTSVFIALSGLAAAYVGVRIGAERRARIRLHGHAVPLGRWLVTAIPAVLVGVTVLTIAASLIHRATEDATLGYFERTGPLPEALVLLAFGAFLLVILAAVLWMVALPVALGVHRRERAIALVALAAVSLLATYLWMGLASVLPLVSAGGVLLTVVVLVRWSSPDPDRWAAAFSLRGALLAAVILTLLTYPIVYDALESKEHARLIDAVEDFVDGEDPRVAFALESVLLDARASEVVRSAFTEAALGQALPEGLADSLAADLVTGSLLAALADYRVGLTLHFPDGSPLGRYLEEAPHQIAGRIAPAPIRADGAVFARLRRLYEDEARFAGFAVERQPAAARGSKFRYAGIGPVWTADEELLGWITARAEPRPARYVSETPFPRVLVPAGLYRLADEQWVFAEFHDGVLHRSRGASFGRFRLPAEIEDLPLGATLWRSEHLEGQPVRVLYWRLLPDRVVAARIPATTIFDHLYFLLRILAAGLILAALAYLLGSGIRRTSDRLPQRPRLRDRVLNRFLLVGLLAVVATGIIGREVIVTQNRDAVEERLKRQLARVEATIYEQVAEDVQDAVPPEFILDRARPDIVGPRLGLDVNLYRGAELVASSRSQLVRQRLIERRLPVEVVRTLFVDGERYAFTTESIGRFTYTTGYEAIPDDAGRPAVVIAVPTLPEQFAIEADQARMIAYLFGVLLLLLLVIFVIATVLANRLTQPFRRLREGLRAVGAGEAPAEPIPVERRDEVGEVIETFNAVWEQLEESRQKLAANERELAWREMARQVAHEIKNPLTPMRLSVQHLRRAYERAETEGGPDGRFAELLDQISGTLIEQIDALNRIAGEFSHFGRLPEQDLEVFDVNEVLTQAAALVGEEPRATIVLDLSSQPLLVQADREELRRVYINLLKNAQQAIPDAERGVINIRSEKRAGPGGPDRAREWVYTAVRDTGLGIPEHVRARIFQPNFSTKTSGMGLGLAIARKAVEDIGGEIAFETEPGVGTTFVVKLRTAEGEAT
jgi:two-component system, NtrC family, nitrogen regulation sensor histidine kinase NtrY